MKKMVMRRVKVVYLARQVVKPFVIEATLFVVSATTLFSLVSIPSVIGNTLHLSSSITALKYLLQAFVDTQAFVQVASVAVICLALLVLRRLFLQARPYLTVRIPFIPIAR